MGNHTVECAACGEDLRGLTGGHAPGCSDKKNEEARQIEYARHVARAIAGERNILVIEKTK